MYSNGLKPIVILDIETGGLDPKTDAILEVAACRYMPEGKSLVPSYWHEWFLPNGEMSPDAQKVNGLTVEKLMALGAKRVFDAAAEEFFSWCTEPFVGEKILWCGHNVHFDLAFLKKCAARKGIPFPRSDCHLVDTGSLASVGYLTGYFSTMCLEDLSDSRHAHSAMDDVFACRDVLNRLMDEYGLTGPDRGYPA